ncbi:hypothetical protein GC194_08545 [bacterium]|nr:hypothetical protein [bacterium]
MNMKSYLIILFIGLSFQSFGAKVKWIRACLDDINSNINLKFKVKSDCAGAYTNIYGERVTGAGFNKIGRIDGNGIMNVSLNSKSSVNWSIYLVVVDTCNKDSIKSEVIVVDNTPPQGVLIDSVSVVGDSVLIGWNNSSSPDLKFFVLYYDEQSGLGATLDTVKDGGLFYYENSSKLDANVRSETYRIAAFDSCNISTGPIDPHSTVFLKVNSIDYCARNMTIERTDYKGWESDEIKYSLVYRETGKDVWHPLSDFDFNSQFLDLNYLKKDIEIKVRVSNTTKGYTSSSNTLDIYFGDNRSLDTFYLSGVDYKNNQVKLKWLTNKTDLVKYFTIEYSEPQTSGWNTTKQVQATGKSYYEILLDNKIVGRKYRINATSDCLENLGYTNIGTAIGCSITKPLSSGSAFNKELQTSRVVSWNKYRNWNDTTVQYELYRRVNGNDNLIATISDTFFIDIEELDFRIDSGMCYRVVAVEANPLYPDKVGSSESDESCVFYTFHHDLPNAFIPNTTGTKLFTIPVENLDSIKSYLIVYNRWGEIVYNGGFAWNGGFNNDIARPCADGVYFYSAWIELQNREYFYVSNRIVLIREK